jgi:hypothetical protein
LRFGEKLLMGITERGHARRKPLADRTNEALEDARRAGYWMKMVIWARGEKEWRRLGRSMEGEREKRRVDGIAGGE